MESRDVLTRPAPGPTAVVRYAEHPEGVIDVFTPDETEPGPARLVVFLHGGFWRSEWDRLHIRPLANALTAASGLVVAVPEFRRVGSGGEWPVIGSDVEAALKSVRRLVDIELPGLIDPLAPVVLAGHSSGGHLALWAGLRSSPHLVSWIVGLAPVADLLRAASEHLGDDAAQELLGGEPDEVPAAYAAADVLPLLGTHAQVTVIQGDQDTRVPVEHNRDVAERATATTAAFCYEELPGAGHFDLIDPESPAWSTVLRALAHPND